MHAKRFILFIGSSGIAFIAFAVIALGIQATGLMSVDRHDVSESIPLVVDTLIVPTPTFASITAIDAEEHAWIALGIDDYRIEIRPSFGTLGTSITTRVHDGQIVEQVCTEENIYCAPTRTTTLDDFTVEGLFRIARQVQLNVSESPEQFYGDVSFDPNYHFPILITDGQRNMDDGFNVWTVVDFEPIS